MRFNRLWFGIICLAVVFGLSKNAAAEEPFEFDPAKAAPQSVQAKASKQRSLTINNPSRIIKVKGIGAKSIKVKSLEKHKSASSDDENTTR